MSTMSILSAKVNNNHYYLCSRGKSKMDFAKKPVSESYEVLSTKSNTLVVLIMATTLLEYSLSMF